MLIVFYTTCPVKRVLRESPGQPGSPPDLLPICCRPPPEPALYDSGTEEDHEDSAHCEPSPAGLRNRRPSRRTCPRPAAARTHSRAKGGLPIENRQARCDGQKLAGQPRQR